MSLNEEQILELLARVSFPGFSKNIVELGLVRRVAIDGDAVLLDLELERLLLPSPSACRPMCSAR
jgi:metal-sulfur cluster biosynthetic enzyme